MDITKTKYRAYTYRYDTKFKNNLDLVFAFTKREQFYNNDKLLLSNLLCSIFRYSTIRSMHYYLIKVHLRGLTRFFDVKR